MSRSIIRHKDSFRANSDSDNDLQSSFSRPRSAVNNKSTNNKNNEDESLNSDRSYEFKAKPKSFIERITGSVKYSSDSDESVTRTASIDKKEKFSRPHSRLKSSSSSSSSTDDVSISSDRPAPKNNQTLKSSSRTNSISSEKRRPLDTKSNKNSDSESKKNRNKQRKRSSSTSSTSSYSKSDSTLSSSVKKNKKHTDTSDDDYHSSSGHVTRVKVNEKKPPIDMSKRNKSSRPSSSLEKPSGDSMSDSSDTRRSNSISDSPNKTSQYKHRFKNDRKLNKTFDLELENDSSSNEMTDVSPLPTPKNKNDKAKTSKIKSDKEPRRNSMDMSSFYKILNEDINKRMDSVFSIFNDKHAKNSSHKSSLKTSFDKNLNTKIEINSSDKLAARMNKIEAENQRLYEKLMSTTQNNMTNNRFEVNKPIRLTSSALNRQREQQRIERENQQILKRLLKVKATKNLVKEEQIKDYDKNFGLSSLNYSRAGSSNSMPSGFLSSASSIAAVSHNTSLLSTKRSVKSTANNSRLSSAKSTSKSRQQITNIDTNELLRRATSASRSRPEWMDRW